LSTLSRGLERLSTDCESHFSRSPRPHHRTDVDHLQWCLIAPFERLDEGEGQSRSVSSLQFQSVCLRTPAFLLAILLSLPLTLSKPSLDIPGPVPVRTCITGTFRLPSETVATVQSSAPLLLPTPLSLSRRHDAVHSHPRHGPQRHLRRRRPG
jgi:hypothetical protein